MKSTELSKYAGALVALGGVDQKNFSGSGRDYALDITR